MKTKTTAITRLSVITFFAALLSTAANFALAQEMVINSANPSSADQGTINLDVTISGNGFDNTIESVDFQPHCAAEPCAVTDDIAVNTFRVRGSKKILTNISIKDDSQTGDFDIIVQSNGRGGKGTTLRAQKKFNVKLRPNQSEVSCDVFAPGGSCNCRFTLDDDSNGHKLMENCRTSETLLMDKRRISGENDAREIRAINCEENPDCWDINNVPLWIGFQGNALIANGHPPVSTRYLDLRFNDNVARGCGANEIQSAVSFVLHGGLTDPPVNNTFAMILDLTIESHHDPLCHAVEFVRDPSYTALYPVNRDWKVKIQNVDISHGSYVLSGVRYEGMKPQESRNSPSVAFNTIGSPACSGSDPNADPNTARAIQFGPILLWDPADPNFVIEGEVESNTIDMATSCGGLGGVGVLVLGTPAPGDPTHVKVIKNEISGAMIGVRVESEVVLATFTGNNLTGDNDDQSPSPTPDIGIDSDAECTVMAGKPNKVSGYTLPDNWDCP